MADERLQRDSLHGELVNLFENGTVKLESGESTITLAGAVELADAVLAVLPSRETVAPTEEQRAEAAYQWSHQERYQYRGFMEKSGMETHFRAGWDAALALFPGESREAVEAKARAEALEAEARIERAPGYPIHLPFTRARLESRAAEYRKAADRG